MKQHARATMRLGQWRRWLEGGAGRLCRRLVLNPEDPADQALLRHVAQRPVWGARAMAVGLPVLPAILLTLAVGTAVSAPDPTPTPSWAGPPRC